MAEPRGREPLLERLFRLSAMDTNVRTEALAGLTTDGISYQLSDCAGTGDG